MCIVHEDDWAGQNVEYYVCEKCKPTQEELDNTYYIEEINGKLYRGKSLNEIMNRHWTTLI